MLRSDAALQYDDTIGITGLEAVSNLIRRGDLTAKKVGRRVLVQADSIRDLMK